MSDPDVFFVVENGWMTVRDSYNFSMIFSNDRSSTQGDALMQDSLVILTVALAIIALLAVCIIAPSVNHVMASKQKVRGGVGGGVGGWLEAVEARGWATTAAS